MLATRRGAQGRLVTKHLDAPMGGRRHVVVGIQATATPPRRRRPSAQGGRSRSVVTMHDDAHARRAEFDATDQA